LAPWRYTRLHLRWEALFVQNLTTGGLPWAQVSGITYIFLLDGVETLEMFVARPGSTVPM
jgi:hypothetical protein